MTMSTPTFGVPPITRRHRLRIALEWADVSVSQMAELLDVNRNTIGNYLGGRSEAPVAVLRVWAMRCGVPFDWLRDGSVDDNPEGDDPITAGVTRREHAPFLLSSAA